MLFLRRLERVTIRRENDGDCEERLLTRSRRGVPGVAGDFACDLVTLDGASTYLVLSREVDPAPTAAVAEAISRHQLDRRYAESTSAVKVSVAVPYAAETRRPGAATPSCRWAGRPVAVRRSPQRAVLYRPRAQGHR